MLLRQRIQVFTLVWCLSCLLGSVGLSPVHANPLETIRPTSLTTAAEYRQSLNQNSQVMDLQLKYYSDQLQTANQRLQELEAALAKERINYAPQVAATVSRLRFLQQQSLSSQGWHVLLNSENLNEFFDRRDRLRQLYEADRQRLETLQVKAIEINRQKAAIEAQQANIQTLTQQIQTQKQDLAAQLALQQRILSQGSPPAQREATQNQLNQDSAGLEQLLQQRNLTPEMLAKTGTGRLNPPHVGEITSRFGPRRHPMLGGKRLHTGIDFKGSYGSPVTAADTGVVIFANWYGGYGKTVAIAHGNDLTTLYCHLNAITVVEGQPIEQGEPLGEVGSTGLSTGPHLHFELRQLGKPIDPVPYLVVSR
ncbi:MAG: murein hydrolase activator EnvC family protein [Spirulinaceae cyanobacterium]